MDIIRGDTKNVKFKIKYKNSTPELPYYIPENGDKIYFTCKASSTDTDVVFQKVYPTDIAFDVESNYFTTTIKPKDTKKVKYGTFVYDIEIKTHDGIVKTVSYGTINIKDEVTFMGNEV